jgi:hypothetical protein
MAKAIGEMGRDDEETRQTKHGEEQAEQTTQSRAVETAWTESPTWQHSLGPRERQSIAAEKAERLREVKASNTANETEKMQATCKDNIAATSVNIKYIGCGGQCNKRGECGGREDSITKATRQTKAEIWAGYSTPGGRYQYGSRISRMGTVK